MPVAIDNPLSQDVLLKSDAIMSRYGWSPMTLWRKRNDKVLPFPQPISLGGPNLWREREVVAWEIAKAEADKAKPKRVPPQLRNAES
jgi:predicted DNA-binding transcriptional regulator AlpA